MKMNPSMAMYEHMQEDQNKQITEIIEHERAHFKKRDMANKEII